MMDPYGYYLHKVNTKENVAKMTIEEYNTASKVYSAYVRDEAICTEGVRKGYFDTGLNDSDQRTRGELLKNTGVRYTVDVLYSELWDVAKTMPEAIREGYKKFLDVNNCSSKIKYTNSRQRGWTELCELYFEEYNDRYKVYKEGSTWNEYVDYMEDVYGVRAHEYGSWDVFYRMFSTRFKQVAEEYMCRLYYDLINRPDAKG